MIIPCVYKTIKGYFKENCITNKECARDTGFSAAHIGRVLNGKAAIRTTLARSLSERYNFSFGWLMSGEGGIFTDDPVCEMSLEEECIELHQRLLTQGEKYQKSKFSSNISQTTRKLLSK